MQKILFPMRYLNITTGINMLTHIGTYAIDNAGQNTGIDNVVAPFTGIIKKKWANGNTVWLESVEPVLFADGTVDYAVFEVTHDNNIDDLFVGQRIEQGQVFYQEGTAGQATGNHIHIELGRGKFSGSGWYQNAQGVWTVNNGYIPWNAFTLPENTIVINGFGYPWKWEENEVKIGNSADWRSRMNRLHHQLVGNWDMSDAVFNDIQGAEFSSVVFSWSDHPNANQLLTDQVVGEQARVDNWTGQIYSLQDQLKASDTKVNAATSPLKLPNDASAEQISAAIGELEHELAEAIQNGGDEDQLQQTIKEKNDEISQLQQRLKELQEQPANDSNRTLGELISAVFKKIFNIK